jgi:hypothetical protein
MLNMSYTTYWCKFILFPNQFNISFSFVYVFQFSQLYPENRRQKLTSPVKTLLSIKSVTCKDIKDFVRQKDGKEVFTQDVRNWKMKLNDQGRQVSESIEDILNLMKVGNLSLALMRVVNSNFCHSQLMICSLS